MRGFYNCMGCSRSRKWIAFLLFALGLFSKTKIFFFGALSISECVVFAIAPFVFIKNLNLLKRDGFMPLLWMIAGLFTSMLVSAKLNYTANVYIFKSIALIYAIAAFIVVFHSLLRKNPNALWLFWVGVFISSIITIYAFNPTVQVSESGYAFIGQDSARDIMNGQMFLIGRLKYILQLPIFGFYLKIPVLYSVLMAVVYILVMMLTTVSGRSASVVILLGAAAIFVGGHRRSAMRSIGKHLIVYAILGAVVALLFKSVHSYLAKNGTLGDEALAKYENQTQEGSGFLKILMSGRQEFFMAIPAALDKPIVGHGPFASDTKGYVEEFIYKYGSALQVRFYEAGKQQANRLGYKMPIPSHSHIMGAWVHYGLFGLIFYLWVIFVVIRHFKKYAGAIPQWYGYFALTLCQFMWEVFFSAFSSRDYFALMMTCLFFARAVGSGRLLLPPEMVMEILKADRR